MLGPFSLFETRISRAHKQSFKLDLKRGGDETRLAREEPEQGTLVFTGTGLLFQSGISVEVAC